MNSKKTVLAIDPSFQGLGVAIVRDNRILFYECIKIKKEESQPKTEIFNLKVKQFALYLKSLLDNFKIDLIVSEDPFGSQSSSALRVLTACKSVIITLGICKDIPVEFILPGHMKNFVAGSYTASKDEIINAVSSKFKLDLTSLPRYKKEAIADALGVYLTSKLRDG